MSERIYKGKSIYAFPQDYTVVDIETTGFTAKSCEIIEISAIKVRKDAPVDTFSSLINPKRKIDGFITSLTGITDDMVQNAPDINSVLQDFDLFLGNDIIIGYNVNFDVNFLYDKFIKHLNRPLTNSFVDVLRFARKGLKNIPNHKQTTVAEYFGIDVYGAHRALKDCEICLECYYRLKPLLQEGQR